MLWCVGCFARKLELLPVSWMGTQEVHPTLLVCAALALTWLLIAQALWNVAEWWGQSADPWNHWLGRLLPIMYGFLPSLHSSPLVHGASVRYFQSRGPGTCGWSHSYEEYNVYLLHLFSSLSSPHFDVFVRMKYIKINTKVKGVSKDVATEMIRNRKKMENNVNVHIRESIKMNYGIHI